MQNVQLIVENGFTDIASNSKDLGHSVYNRVFHKLLLNGGPIGKVNPIYLKTVEIEKTIGILTLNESGSYSLFLELPGESPFDHLTFNKSLAKDTHHYTTITEKRRQKIMPITAETLSNGTRYVATIVVRDLSLLKAIPKEVIYPEISHDKLKRIQDAFVTSGAIEGSTLLCPPGNVGTFCMQLFLIPMDIDYKVLTVYPKPFKFIQTDFEIRQGLSIQNYVVPHDNNDEYSLGIVTFFYDKHVEPPFYIGTSSKPQGFYSKIDIDWR